MVAIISAAVQILDIILGATSKHPETEPHFAPTVTKLIEIASRAGQETEAQTAQRISDHDATVALYAAGPPAEAKA